MESLALIVGLLLLGLFIGGPVAFGLSFVPNRGVKILAIVLAAPIVGMSLILAFNSDGGFNLLIISLGSGALSIGAVANSLRGLNRMSRPEFEVPKFQAPND